ncbi:MAG: efflux RND transporter periplasmic adaptor subunit [Deltaproteobacteria bacterium]|jgi:RND family efflux transporter MFP subunit|nr:efflux RND transporter periplasmic adaptor subunit [Deltaproteobacteria bacterium]MCK5514887.1 efflux RND transporter periplasmic adaptor subunit [Deltaproteobacteria bacterium]
MKVKSRKIFLVIAILLIIPILFLLNRGRDGKSAVPQDESISEAIATMVEVETISTRNILEFIESNGIVKAWQEAEISPEVSGKVKTIHAEVGDYLESGDPIIKLDDELLKLKVRKARALVTQLEGHYLTSTRDIARKEALFQDGVISELDLDLAKAKEKADRGLLEGAQVSLKIAQRDLRESTIRSPIKGTLAERLIDIGTTVSPQMEVASVVDASKVRIRIGVSEKEIHKIKKGQGVKVHLDAFPQEEYQGTVFSVGTKANENSLTFPVEVETINNREPKLKPGMVARLKIQTGNHSQVVVIPQEFILNEEGNLFVFVIQDSVAHKVKINTGSIINSEVIVEEGLSPGDLLITVGSHTITEGTRVKPLRKFEGGSKSR